MGLIRIELLQISVFSTLSKKCSDIPNGETGRGLLLADARVDGFHDSNRFLAASQISYRTASAEPLNMLHAERLIAGRDRYRYRYQ